MLPEESLVSQICNVNFENLSDEAIERMKTILLHDLFLGSIGRKQKEYKLLSNTLPHRTIMECIFREAVAMSLPTLEDFYGANHFGPLIIPNALYHGIESQITGKKLIEAITAGFLLGITISDQIGGKISEKGYRGTSILGIIAASATASYISNATQQGILHTLAHASANTFGIGASLQVGTAEWRYQAGLGAFHAAFANMLAQNGEEGNVSFLSSFVDAFSNGQINDVIFDYTNLLKIGVKRDPVHIFVLAPTAASKELFKRFGPFTPSQVKSLKIKVSPKQVSTINLQQGPYEKTNQAVLSTYTNVALTLMFGYTSAKHQTMANHQEVLKMTKKMEILSDENRKEYECEVVVVSENSTVSILIKDEKVKELYFPTLVQEKEQLMEESEKWNVPSRYVEKLANEINRLTERDSLTSLVELYESCLHF
jgi:2-methylcitrate dehydratase PrpD